MRREAYRTENIVEFVDSRSSNPFFAGTFNLLLLVGSGKNEVFSRSYTKLPTALANIAGILQLLLFSGKFLIYFRSRNSMLDLVISKTFSEGKRINHLKIYEDKISLIPSFEKIKNEKKSCSIKLDFNSRIKTI